LVSEHPDQQHESARERTVLRVPIEDRLRLSLGVPGMALLLAVALPPLSRWLIDLGTVLPLRPVFRLLAAIDRPWELGLAIALALLVGAAVASARMGASTLISLTDREVLLSTGDWQRTVPHGDVSAVFLDDRRVVVLDPASRQLAGEPTRVRAATLAEAFRAHGYPWHDADPHLDLYQRWGAGTDDLPPAVDALLAARASALKRKQHEEVRDLRDAMQHLGFAVRDDGTTQFWRPLVGS
jgi:hypothetical protein